MCIRDSLSSEWMTTIQAEHVRTYPLGNNNTWPGKHAPQPYKPGYTGCPSAYKIRPDVPKTYCSTQSPYTNTPRSPVWLSLIHIYFSLLSSPISLAIASTSVCKSTLSLR